MQTYSDTTHGRFIEHMDLARIYLGRPNATEAQVLRVMNRLDTETLRRLIAERRAA